MSSFKPLFNEPTEYVTRMREEGKLDEIVFEESGTTQREYLSAVLENELGDANAAREVASRQLVAHENSPTHKIVRALNSVRYAARHYDEERSCKSEDELPPFKPYQSPLGELTMVGGIISGYTLGMIAGYEYGGVAPALGLGAVSAIAAGLIGRLAADVIDYVGGSLYLHMIPACRLAKAKREFQSEANTANEILRNWCNAEKPCNLKHVDGIDPQFIEKITPELTAHEEKFEKLSLAKHDLERHVRSIYRAQAEVNRKPRLRSKRKPSKKR